MKSESVLPRLDLNASHSWHNAHCREGGHRVSTFVSGPLLPPKMRGKKLDGLAAICDWYATVAALASIDAVDPSPPAVAPLDSINLWPWISGAENAFLEPFCTKNDHCTKTGSGQP